MEKRVAVEKWLPWKYVAMERGCHGEKMHKKLSCLYGVKFCQSVIVCDSFGSRWNNF